MKQNPNRHDELAELKSVFLLERIIPRAIASWLAAITVSLFRGRNFYELAFLQEGESALSLGSLLLTTLLFFVLFSAPAVMLPRLHTDSLALVAVSLVLVPRWLLTYQGNGTGVYFALGVAVVWSLILIYAMNRHGEHLSRITLDKRVTIPLVAGFGILAFSILATISCLRYQTFSAPNFDFGLFVNMFHNMKNTLKPLVTSERDMLLSHFAVHMSPIYYLLLPAYALFPHPETLQIGQAFFLLAGLAPLYLLCRHFKLSGRATVVVCFLYAFYPALTTGCFYDIHETCFMPFFLLWMFYFFERKNIPLFFVAAALVLMVKEDAAVYVALFALCAILARKSYVRGGLLLALAGGYFLFATGMIARLSVDDGFVGRSFGNLILNEEDGLFGAIKTALVNPGFLLTQLFTTPKAGGEKILYFLQMLLPLGFLPFITKKGGRWMLTAVMLLNLLSNYQYQFDMGFQYHFGILAFLFYVTVQNLPELSDGLRRTVLPCAAVFCICLYAIWVMPKLSHYRGLVRDFGEDYARMEAALEQVPEDASVVSSTFLLAHIADRDEIYELGYHDGVGDVDYVVLDTRYNLEGRDLPYLRQGYTVWYEEEGLIRILISPEAKG